MKNQIFHQIQQDEAPEILKCVVEIPKGEFNKYEYDHKIGMIKLDRVLYGPFAYPVDYCDVPGTWNEHDKDPLDAVLLVSNPVHPGILVEGRVVGMMEMIDDGEIDHKIICVAKEDPRYDYVKTYKDLPEWALKDVKIFMETYKHAQVGPGAVKVPGIKGKEEAFKFIEECIAAYKKKFK